MIKKERLEELIEKEAAVFVIDCNNKVKRIPLGESVTFFADGGNVFCYPFGNCLIDEVFENEEDAEWHKEFGCIERTERLELPTWEEVVDIIYGGSFGVQTIIKFDKCKFGYKLQLDGNVYIFVDKGTDTLFMGSLTKENYTLACRKAKELFLGESNVKD